MLTSHERARESRLRRLAHRQGLAVRKSRGRTWSYDDQGGYMIVNLLVAGERFDFDLDDIESLLADDDIESFRTDERDKFRETWQGSWPVG